MLMDNTFSNYIYIPLTYGRISNISATLLATLLRMSRTKHYYVFISASSQSIIKYTAYALNLLMQVQKKVSN